METAETGRSCYLKNVISLRLWGFSLSGAYSKERQVLQVRYKYNNSYLCSIPPHTIAFKGNQYALLAGIRAPHFKNLSCQRIAGKKGWHIHDDGNGARLPLECNVPA